VTNDNAQHRAAWAALAAGGLVGLFIGLEALDPQFIFGTGGKWIRPENDYNAYLVAWHYYVTDAWRFPLFSLPMMGYPEGGSVLFNDALPLTAVATRLIYRLTGAVVNPFGWWVLVAYIVQGVAAARVMQATGVRSLVAAVCAAALAVVSTSFVTRMGHTALATHALLLWAIALHFSSLRERRPHALEWTLLLAITLLVNAYLFVMVFAVAAATLCALLLRGDAHARDVGKAAVGVTSVVALGLVAGYGLVFTNPSTMKSEGFGRYSWNLATLLVPPDGVAGFLRGMTRDATHGQYEGEAFIGTGALLLLGLAALSPRRILAAMKRYWVFAALLAACALYAASNRIYAGSILVASFELPGPLLNLGNYFRATGRFIWPLAYSLTLLPLACLFRWWPRPAAVLVAAVAAWLQIAEAMPAIRYRRAQTTVASADLIDEPRLTAWLAAHDRVWQYPSWDCGGLVGRDRRWPSDDSNRELQLQRAAARAGKPMNSVYMSRALKNCPAEKAWLSHASLEDGVLYIFGPSAVAESEALTALQQSNACTTLSWATICSLSPLVVSR